MKKAQKSRLYQRQGKTKAKDPIFTARLRWETSTRRQLEVKAKSSQSNSGRQFDWTVIRTASQNQERELNAKRGEKGMKKKKKKTTYAGTAEFVDRSKA